MGGTAIAANLPCGAWREHCKTFSPQWFLAVHATIPFVAMLRKAVLMPKWAILLTVAGASEWPRWWWHVGVAAAACGRFLADAYRSLTWPCLAPSCLQSRGRMWGRAWSGSACASSPPPAPARRPEPTASCRALRPAAGAPLKPHKRRRPGPSTLWWCCEARVRLSATALAQHSAPTLHTCKLFRSCAVEYIPSLSLRRRSTILSSLARHPLPSPPAPQQLPSVHGPAGRRACCHAAAAPAPECK